ncbi:hypothetical protein BO70DRAFT_390581 [Aspergillus heteromorphus CBS 117.55]|uniref:Methyltransferase domain-containing protein n=1 Tax=Aspergillus heteromorphus CBS 117.55 TaxID=1448321 RepID=A0A317UYQ5_9EURO|nr:uncharacterized protein BO70DRAFT_390581 [Aspergillus heteromorphus CBS 117.55]PWY66736.1 hypothetical protein BO70DRAFT_390581 [Aspergillus heteromorphus CBS 117.55]
MDEPSPIFIDVKDIPAPEREFLETYSRIPPEEVIPHVIAIRNEAFAIYPWPCIGQLHFLYFTLANSQFYPALLARLTSTSTSTSPPPSLLDVGCCFGQDLRKLIVDGVSPSQIAGLDLAPAFNTLGYKLFRDDVPRDGRPALQFDFYPRDILDDTADWTPIAKRFDVIHTAHFLHIWDWDTQVKVACRLVSFLKPQAGNSIVGTLLATEGEEGAEGKVLERFDRKGQYFRHDLSSFDRFWGVVGESVGIKLGVQASFAKIDLPEDLKGAAWAHSGMGSIEFQVTMV